MNIEVVIMFPVRGITSKTFKSCLNIIGLTLFYESAGDFLVVLTSMSRSYTITKYEHCNQY